MNQTTRDTERCKVQPTNKVPVGWKLYTFYSELYLGNYNDRTLIWRGLNVLIYK